MLATALDRVADRQRENTAVFVVGLFAEPVDIRRLHAGTRRIMDQHVYLAKRGCPRDDGLKASQHRIGACAATDGRDDARMPRNRQLRETVVVTRQQIGRASCREECVSTCRYRGLTYP